MARRPPARTIPAFAKATSRRLDLGDDAVSLGSDRAAVADVDDGRLGHGAQQQVGDHVIEPLLVAVSNDHARAAVGQDPGHGQAEARPHAGDQRDPVLHTEQAGERLVAMPQGVGHTSWSGLPGAVVISDHAPHGFGTENWVQGPDACQLLCVVSTIVRRPASAEHPGVRNAGTGWTLRQRADTDMAGPEKLLDPTAKDEVAANTTLAPRPRSGPPRAERLAWAGEHQAELRAAAGLQRRPGSYKRLHDAADRL